LDQADAQERPYRHGDLRRAILDAAERRLEAGGLQAVTIRACARDAGVSPAAPIHHFGGLKGVLSGLAARGFERLVAHLGADAASKPAQSPASLLVGAYVAFALSAPNLFDLMWRDDLLDPDDTALTQARRNALTSLRTLSSQPAVGRSARIQAIRIWSLAHGLAMLLRHGRIVTALGSEEDGLHTIEDFVVLAGEVGFA
jgi:AcrR family transcriptional regulator